MPTAKPPRNLTPPLCQQMSQEMLKARQDVAARHGLVAEAKEIAGVDLRGEGAILRSACRSRSLTKPLSIQSGCGSKRRPKLSDCRQQTTGANSAPIVSLSAWWAPTPVARGTRYQQSASPTGRGSSSPRTRWRYCCGQACGM